MQGEIEISLDPEDKDIGGLGESRLSNGDEGCWESVTAVGWK